MKVLGIFLVVVGLLWAIVASNMDVTVGTGYGAVNNIGLMDVRRNNLLFAGLAVLVGAVFIGFGFISQQSSVEHNSALRACPYCAEAIMREAIVCKHCGKDVQPEVTKPEAPVSQTQEKQARLRELCALCRAGGLTYQQYQQLAQAADTTLGLSSNSFFAKYVVTQDGSEVVIKKFNDLKPWFLKNVVPRVESKA